MRQTAARRRPLPGGGTTLNCTQQQKQEQQQHYTHVQQRQRQQRQRQRVAADSGGNNGHSHADMLSLLLLLLPSSSSHNPLNLLAALGVACGTRSHPRALANNCSVATTRCNRRSTVVRARYFHSKIMKCAESLICFLILIYRSIIRFICICHIKYIRLQEHEPLNL